MVEALEPTELDEEVLGLISGCACPEFDPDG